MVYSFFIKNVFEKGIDFIFGVMGKMIMLIILEERRKYIYEERNVI